MIKLNYEHFNQDVSYIINAHNLVLSSSSFSLNLARLSNKLKKLFVYDFTPKYEKYVRLIDNNKHNENFVTIIMKVSDKYNSEMFPWKSSKKQKDLMINATCNEK